MTVLQNAFRVLQPKAVFSVGTCIISGLGKVRTGDVVIYSKVTTSEGFKTLRGTELSCWSSFWRSCSRFTKWMGRSEEESR